MPDDLPTLSDDPHVLFLYALEHRWRLKALDEWRVSVLESEVVTEKQARELRAALAQHGQLRLTRLQQAAGVLVGLVAVADLLHGFFG